MALEDATNPMQGVSGPGSFSKRTDLQYESTGYGDGVAYDAQKAGAPLASSPDVRGATNTEMRQAAMSGAPQEPITSLYAPTNRPNEDIMYGNKIGPGAGPEVLVNRSQMTEKYSDTLAKLLPYDESGEISILYQDMLARGL